MSTAVIAALGGGTGTLAVELALLHTVKQGARLHGGAIAGTRLCRGIRGVL